MKTRIIATLMSLLLIVGCLPVTASAADHGQQTSGKTNIYYTLSGEYSISIPESLYMSSGDTMQITADYMHLTADQNVVITVADETFPQSGGENRLVLKTRDNDTIVCDLMAGSNGSWNLIYKDVAADTPVIVYTSDNVDDVGEVQVIPNLDRISVMGDYTGVLYFDISLQVD